MSGPARIQSICSDADCGDEDRFAYSVNVVRRAESSRKAPSRTFENGIGTDTIVAATTVNSDRQVDLNFKVCILGVGAIASLLRSNIPQRPASGLNVLNQEISGNIRPAPKSNDPETKLTAPGNFDLVHGQSRCQETGRDQQEKASISAATYLHCHGMCYAGRGSITFVLANSAVIPADAAGHTILRRFMRLDA